jgi:hypothetical protein
MLSLSATVEKLIEVTISSHFSITDKDYALFCEMFFPKRDGLSFGLKIGIFEKLMKHDEPNVTSKQRVIVSKIE